MHALFTCVHAWLDTSRAPATKPRSCMACIAVCTLISVVDQRCEHESVNKIVWLHTVARQCQRLPLSGQIPVLDVLIEPTCMQRTDSGTLYSIPPANCQFAVCRLHVAEHFISPVIRIFGHLSLLPFIHVVCIECCLKLPEVDVDGGRCLLQGSVDHSMDVVCMHACTTLYDLKRIIDTHELEILKSVTAMQVNSIITLKMKLS